MTSLSVNDEYYTCKLIINLVNDADFITNSKDFIEKKIYNLFLDKLINTSVCVDILEIAEINRSLLHDDDIIINVLIKFKYKAANFSVNNIICNFVLNSDIKNDIGICSFNNITKRDADDEIYMYMTGIEKLNKNSIEKYKEWGPVLKKLADIKADNKLYGIIVDAKILDILFLCLIISPLYFTPLYIKTNDNKEISIKDLNHLITTDKDYIESKNAATDNKIKINLLSLVASRLKEYRKITAKNNTAANYYYYVDIFDVYNIDKNLTENTDIPIIIDSDSALKLIMDYRRMINEFICRIYDDYEEKSIEVLNIYLKN